jgi:hypothetical protein
LIHVLPAPIYPTLLISRLVLLIRKQQPRGAPTSDTYMSKSCMWLYLDHTMDKNQDIYDHVLLLQCEPSTYAADRREYKFPSIYFHYG